MIGGVQLGIAVAVFAVGAALGAGTTVKIMSGQVERLAAQSAGLRADRDRETSRADQNAAAATALREQCEAAAAQVDRRDLRIDDIDRRFNEQRRAIDAAPDSADVLDRAVGGVLDAPGRASGAGSGSGGAAGGPADAAPVPARP